MKNSLKTDLIYLSAFAALFLLLSVLFQREIYSLFWLVTILFLMWILSGDLKYLQTELNASLVRELFIFLTVLLGSLILNYLGVDTPWSIMFPFLIWTFYTDVRYRIIPNTVVFAFIVTGLALNPLSLVFKSMLFCTLIFIPFIRSGGIGLGDVKLTAGVGALLGYFSGIHVLLYTLLSALIYTVLHKTLQSKFIAWLKESYFVYKSTYMTGHLKLETPKNLEDKKKVTIPLGAFFLPGTILYILINEVMLI